MEDLLNGEILKLSKGRYFLQNDLFMDRFYISSDYYIELPFLPYGFYLVYEENDHYPRLKTVQSFEDMLLYSRLEITELYLYSDAIIIKSEKEKYTKILFSDPFTGLEIVDFPKEHTSKIVFEKRDKSFFGKNNLITTGLWGLQDKEYLKKYKTDYATPFIDAIISVGIYKNDNVPYLIGKSLYAFFCCDLLSGTVTYFRDEEDFYSSLNSRYTNINMVNTSYEFNLYKKISNKEKYNIYSIENSVVSEN
ncbi:hypothetical protein K7I13_08500 [Brucepastera parasyntrophica]|uniref:hypothetical protein n=1 Tax=Brucepastera parasyntrophica TaxID=2880008 RepID=UPI0021087595|nr:hypothetical protein [Brucepastera parasyntrophica]ULQ58606.1 hypothetical protein K7I13_08500 [Brucepastera parasyntrophica]